MAAEVLLEANEKERGSVGVYIKQLLTAVYGEAGSSKSPGSAVTSFSSLLHSLFFFFFCFSVVR